MSRKQKGSRGKTISIQLMRDEDREFRQLAAQENRSVAESARLILVAEMKRRSGDHESAPIAVSA